MFNGPGKTVRDNKSSSYPVFELTGVDCNWFEEQINWLFSFYMLATLAFNELKSFFDPFYVTRLFPYSLKTS